MSKIRIGWICCPGDRKKQIIDFMMPSCKLLRVYTDENSSRISQQSKVRNRPKITFAEIEDNVTENFSAPPFLEDVPRLRAEKSYFIHSNSSTAEMDYMQSFSAHKNSQHEKGGFGRSGYVRDSQSDIEVTMTEGVATPARVRVT